jgi:hypothetical protein
VRPPAARWSERELVARIYDTKDGFEGKKRRVWAAFNTSHRPGLREASA